jgi:hypothetical protein
MNSKRVQASQQAGYTKLTAVNIYSNGRQHTFFAPLVHNEQGEAILPLSVLNRELRRLRVERGQSYSIG